MASMRKRSSSSSLEPVSSESVRYMDKLDDCLLIEILRRLPDAKSAIQCKLVCPHWNSLISAPNFNTSFVDYHSTSRNKLQKPFAIITFNPSGTKKSLYRLFSNSSFFKGLDYEFVISLTKSSSSHETLSREILATYNELLLCQYRYHCLDAVADEIRYYICNPLTKHHVALPPCPRLGLVHYANCLAGFLCRDSSFRVMHILRPTDDKFQVIMHIFSSEENKWTEYLDVDKNVLLNNRPASALAWNGLLCWVKPNNNKCTLVFCSPYKINPDDNDERFRIIATPPERQSLQTLRHELGVCQGTLRLWHLWEGVDNSENFSVWELKDYDREEWSLKYEVRMGYIGWFSGIQLAFDPDDEDVAYFVCKKDLISFNKRSIASKKVKTILKTSINHPKGYFKMHFSMLVMPGLPTPVPTLPRPQNATEDALAVRPGAITRSRVESFKRLGLVPKKLKEFFFTLFNFKFECFLCN